MKLEKKNLIVERPYKSVYKTEEGVVKIFVTDHPKLKKQDWIFRN